MLLTAVATAVAVVLLTVVLQLVLAHLATTDVDRVVRDRASSVAASVQVRGDGTIHVPRSQLSAGVAVYAAGGALVEGAAPENLRDEYSRLRLTGQDVNYSRTDTDRIEARPFRRSGVTGVVIVSEAFGPYEEAERLALVVSIVTGLLTVVAAASVAAWATRRALRPVELMAHTASDWSEHDLGRRFSGADAPTTARTDELGELAGTLDGLLDRVSAAIRSEQRLTAELAHELRTPLTSIRGEAELALMRDELPDGTRQALTGIVAATRRMSETISTLLDLARNETSVVAASQSSLAEVAAEVGRDVVAGEVRLRVDVPDVRLAVPRALAVRALVPVVENAVRFATAGVTVRADRVGRYVEVLVEDDGPGVETALAESVFNPGVTSGRSAGLGLAISRRIARASGGDVTVAVDSRPGACRFVVRLPLV